MTGEGRRLFSIATIAALTTISLIILGIIQIIIGETVSRSVALTANGIDCIGDGFVSGIVWMGLKIFGRPANQRFHYGYYKIENLASIGAAAVMLVLAGYIIFRSYNQLINPEHIQLPLLGAVLAIISAVVALSLGGMKLVLTRNSRLGSAKLDAFNTIKDGTSSTLTVIALMLTSVGFIVADALVGFIIAGIIVSIGFAAIKESSYMLLDACDGQCIQQGKTIKEIAEDISGVKVANLIRLRRSGPILQGEIEIKVSGDMTVAELNQIRKDIIDHVQAQHPDIERLTISAIPLD
jgi:cation diffusion facilitator family transporter